VAKLRTRLVTGALFVVAALALAPAALAGGPALVIGATEDVAKQSDPALSQQEIVRAKAAGFTAIRMTQAWLPGQTEPPGGDLTALKNAVFAATANQMQVFLVVSHPGSRTTPLTEQQRKDFASFVGALAKALPAVRYYTIGNEPNLNGFWLPQFGPNGENVAAPAYLELLAAAYDSLKAVSTKIVVLGGALSPRGSDNPALSRHTHSPTRFILDMGAAYKASGRTKPVMDALSINPFPDNSSVSPATPHQNTSIGVADYDKLVKLLGQAFDGTAQPGSTLPIYYGEFGVESLPTTAKASLYTGRGADDDEARPGEDAGRLLPEGGRALLLPAERRRDLHVPRRRRRATAGLAVGLLLRRQDRQDLAHRDEAGDPAVARRDRREVRGLQADPDGRPLRSVRLERPLRRQLPLQRGLHRRHPARARLRREGRREAHRQGARRASTRSSASRS
jgi:hypothetical protein